MGARSAKQIAAGQRRTLEAIKDRLLRMSLEWDDIDEFNVDELQSVALQVGRVGVYLLDSVV